MDMIELLTEVTIIISSYSEGSLPMPKYVTVNADHNSVGFLMNSSGDVERWGFAVDVKVRRADVGKDVHWTINFEHGDGVHVNVFHVQHPALVDADG